MYIDKKPTWNFFLVNASSKSKSARIKNLVSRSLNVQPIKSILFFRPPRSSSCSGCCSYSWRTIWTAEPLCVRAVISTPGRSHPLTSYEPSCLLVDWLVCWSVGRFTLIFSKKGWEVYHALIYFVVSCDVIVEENLMAFF